MKNLIESFKSKLDQAEESIHELENRSFEIIQINKKKKKIREESLQDLWDIKITIEERNRKSI